MRAILACYARADNQPPKRWLDRVLSIFLPFQQEDLAVSSDQRLKVGDEWDSEIQRQLGVVEVAVLLSPSLFYKTRCKWPDPKTGPQELTLSSLQAAGASSETLSEMTEAQQDRVFVALAERILEIIDEKP